MVYKFLRNGVWEDVKEEVWQWVAHFSDGTKLKQFAEDGLFHQFKEIDQTKLAIFKMVSEGKQDYTLLFDPLRMKLIHYYKKVRLNMGAEDEKFITAYCFGFETKTAGRTSKVNIMLMPSGETIVTENTDSVEFK